MACGRGMEKRHDNSVLSMGGSKVSNIEKDGYAPVFFHAPLPRPGIRQNKKVRIPQTEDTHHFTTPAPAYAAPLFSIISPTGRKLRTAAPVRFLLPEGRLRRILRFRHGRK